VRNLTYSDPLAELHGQEYVDALRADPCAYCGDPGGTIDHVKPKALGGSDSDMNLTGCCRRCNTRKDKGGGRKAVHHSVLSWLMIIQEQRLTGCR